VLQYRDSEAGARVIDRELMQRRALHRNRRIATGLLLAMAALFAGTAAVPQPGFWTSLIHATAEAGVVGGLADWFAVTALFRRPLGLPIPHTAIVSRNKHRIGEGLGAFLERHFLTEELLVSKLRAIDPARRLAEWLADPGHAEAVAERITALLPPVLDMVEDTQVRAFMAKALGKELRDINVAPLLGRAIALLTAGGYHEAVIDRGIELGLDFLERHGERLELAAGSGERRRWWMPKAVDKQIARALLKGLEDLLEDLRRPNSNPRAKLLRVIDEVARNLVVSPEQRAQVEEAKLQLLDRAEVQQWLESIWDRARDLVLADLAKPSSRTREGLATAIASAGRTLLADASMRERLNRAMEAAIAQLLPWRGELARFIAEVVQRWDERMLVERMELTLGPDLQYVRMTGTLVGGAAGCLLFLLSLAFR
jgi:uncharacterized membrane-anchored protein YjiN (DUF445 family)